MKRWGAGSVGHNEEGNVMLVIVVLLFLITMIGLASMNNSVMEVRLAGNDRVSKRDFYNAEAGLFDSVAKFERVYTNAPDTAGNRLYPLDSSNPPLRDRAPEDASVSFVSEVVDDGGIPVAWIEVRAIVKKGNQKASGLSKKADRVPSIKHVGPALRGFDKANYRSRRYAVTATALDPKLYKASDPKAALTGSTIQSGVDVGEELNKVSHLVGL
ncbi:pilus assembly PilX N-terminal domain-containing protein [Desulfoluna sp.]|uniref:pilus assembly PilX family protein n=1 Tax=Desulfoluna sp. TaxID=2045199 RepID=UPI002612E9B7|nr:pilus assembly PilX N-terminal domain-containing protein [Desulfoluna sp.]